MSEIPSPELRIGDAEREQALQALGEHMSAGRLDIDEYGDRTARVATARTRRELADLFGDLPDPKPVFAPPRPAPAPVPPVPVAPRPAASPAQRSWEDRPLAQRLSAALVPVSALVAVALFLTVLKGEWFIFALPVITTMVLGSVWGEDWERDRRAMRRERRRRR